MNERLFAPLCLEIDIASKERDIDYESEAHTRINPSLV